MSSRENRFKELVVSLYNSYCNSYMDQSQLQQGAFNTVKTMKTSETIMERLRTGDAFSTTKGTFTLYLFIKFRMPWFVWSKSHSRNQVKTNFVVELYQFTVINLQVYFFSSKSTRIKRQFFDNHIQFITTKFHNIVWAPDIVENRDSLFYENCKNMRSFSKQWKTKKHVRAGTQFLLLLFKTILQRLGISTLGMDGTSS